MVRKAIDAPQAVQLVRLRHATTTNNNDNSNDNRAVSDLAVANVHVMWTQLKYPALQALQVRVQVCRTSLQSDQKLRGPRVARQQ